MDTLTVVILVVTLFVLVAPIIEIAVKQPEVFLEMTADARAFAEAPVPKGPAKQSPAEGREATVVHQHGVFRSSRRVS